MRVFLWALALASSGAMAEPVRELAPGAGAVHVQEATAVVLAADGQPEEGLVKLPAGVFYTAPGHQRLTAAFAQVQLDKAAAQARADALQQALIMREPAPPSRVGTGAVLAVAVLLLLGGGVVGAVIFH